jgi:hypothetical protein
MLSTKHKCTHPCYFPTICSICRSDEEEDVEFFVCVVDWSINMWYLESSAAVFCRESHLVFYKTIIHVKNILFVTCELYITLLMYVCMYVCMCENLILGTHMMSIQFYP